MACLRRLQCREFLERCDELTKTLSGTPTSEASYFDDGDEQVSTMKSRTRSSVVEPSAHNGLVGSSSLSGSTNRRVSSSRVACAMRSICISLR